MKATRFTQAVWTAIVILLLLLALILLASFFVPYPFLKSIVNGLSPDHNVVSFTSTRYQQIRLPTGLIGFVFLIAAGLLIIFSTRSKNGLESLLDLIGSIFKRLARDFIALFKELGAQFTDWPFLAGLAGLTLIAAIVRIVFLAYPVRYDEAYTFLVFALRPVRFIISDYHVPNNHVFHTLLVRLAYLAFGGQLWSIRLPVLISGILLVPATYLAGKLYFERYSALLGAALVAASSILIEYSANARGYMLVSLFGILILCLAISIKKQPNTAAWLLFVLFSVLGFYTVPIFLYPFGMVAGWLFFSALFGDVAESTKRWQFIEWLVIAVAAAGVLTLLLYTPIFRSSGIGALTSNRFVSAVDQSEFVENIQVRFRNSFLEWTRDLPPFSWFLMAIGLLTSTIFNHRLSKQRIPFLIPAALWIGIVLIIQRVTPWPRVWLFLLPFIWIWTAGGLVGIVRLLWPRYRPSKIANMAFIVALLVMTVLLSWNVYRDWKLNPLWNKNDLSLYDEEPVAEFLHDNLQPDDTVATSIPFNFPLRYYFWQKGIPLDYFYRKTDQPQFKRVLAVVSQGYDQTLAEVLTATRLNEVIKDESAARSIFTTGDTQVYEILRK